MIKVAGAVVDPYDDNFASLKDMAGGQGLPEFIKQAGIMEPAVLKNLPDHAFAVVILGDGEPMRKFACVDKAHTAVNVMYFTEFGADLPTPVKEKVATNLCKACEHFGLEAPPHIRKEAAGAKRLLKHDGAEMIVPARGEEKTSELTGTKVMPNTKPVRVKTASVLDEPYVHVSSFVAKTASAAPLDPGVFALDNGQLPLLGFDQVLEAVDYFDKYAMKMHPRQRHDFAVKVAARAEQLGIPVSDDLQKYGSRKYAQAGEIKVAVETRKRMWHSLGDDERHGIGGEMLDQLFEKRASVNPDVFAESLAELDAQLGLSHYWDSGIPDPWASTFGVEKQAAWSWNQGGESVTEDELKRLAAEETGLLEERFTKDLAKGLADNPTAVFDSLPLDKKRIIARMAQQRGSGL